MEELTMNITITQDNSRVETLGSNGASIIQKLYELAIDSNNTLTLRGNVSSPSAYEEAVTYLNNTYGPDFTVSATKVYMRFEDVNVQNVLKDTNVGDGIGVLAADFTTTTRLNPELSFNDNTNITSFPELCKANFNYLPSFNGCTNLRVLGIPKGGCYVYKNYTNGVNPSATVVNSIEDLWNVDRENSSGSWIFGNPAHIYVGSVSQENEVKDLVARFYGQHTSPWDGCQGFELNSLVFYPSGTYMGGSAFMSSTIEKVFIMEGLQNMTYHQFEASTVQNLYLPTTFTTWGQDVFKQGSLSNCICMSATPFSRTGGDLAQVFYVPDSAVSDWESSFGPSTYWQRTIKTLSQWANIKEENKEDLEFMGCTVTGSFGSYVVTPPTT